jgi:outer membrane protein assembly factor BamB
MQEMTMRAAFTSGALLVALVAVGSTRAGDWPAFRGPGGAGISEDDKVTTEWSEKKNVKWKVSLPGAGMSSPIVVGSRVFVTCWTSDGGVKRSLVCVDRDKGKILWTKTVPSAGNERGARGGFGFHGYSSNTPVSDGERVYVFFASSGLIAYDMEGKEVWKQSLGTGNSAMFGSASSPIIWKDFVIVTACNESTSIRAFNRKSGKEAWKENAPSLSGSYSTPSIMKNKDGEEELLVSVAEEIWGLNPTNGKLKWYLSAQLFPAACTLLVSDAGIAYCVGGDRPGTRLAFKVGGKDDVSRSNVVWTKGGGSYVGSAVLYKGHLYWADQRGMAHCVDAKTGEEVDRKRLDTGFYASMVVIKDRIYAVSRTSGVFVLEANPKMKEIAHNKLGDSSEFNGSPAVSNGQLFLRSDKYLYCIASE